MRFDQPATTNPIDQGRVVGRATPRIDGPLKTTGTAPYAYERHDVAPAPAIGYVVGAGIAKGRVASMDLAAARKAPGVLTIVTARNAGKLGKSDKNTAKLLGGPQVDHYHQALALVVAETFEQARAAAALIGIRYETAPGRFDLAAAKLHAPLAKDDGMGGKSQTHVGDFEGAFAKAPVQLDATYTTPDQGHAMMEPHATLATWEGRKLTVWTANQMVGWAVDDLAATLGIPKENVSVKSPYIGGGFGGKLFLRADVLLAALGARAVNRPVKLALTRPLMFNNTTHRPATIQRIRIGAGKDGRIAAIGHESWSGDLPGGKPETAVAQTRLLYAGEHRLTAMRLAVLDLPEGNAMRAPGEAPGMMALEIAMDEMAEKLGLDPIEFRLRNDTQVDPEKPQRPFSQRRLADCFKLGAERFGWSKRNAKPAQVRDGRWMVGLGVAAAFRNNIVMKSKARVRLDGEGRVVVETDMTDIGTGSYTVIAQTAAETMGVPLERVRVLLGDSDYPVSCGSGGQWGGNSSCAGVYAACMKLRGMVAQKAGLGDDATFVDGEVRGGGKSVPLESFSGLVAEDGMEYGDLDKRYQQSTFGAHFVEAAVDAFTGEVRVRRMLAVCAAGRILNPVSARSQVIGAMTMGVGAALMEELHVDKRRGFFVNHDLAGYEVPVHADIPHQDVVFLDEVDPVSSPLKAKGVGELGICGVAAAVANAVYNATGVRVREYPITLDKLLKGLPPVA
ncbi:xanthine dehydrogenase YagR molybdenum-binding subunit [Pelomonas aquatica]|uniref:Xanthine dehydrogenase YagR molybdenum-binding subunit n=1 Tax=Pelomonas aquatica TaxID=431058 RepID=A0ABU1Z3T6_9BURK|nr:aldehyde oxidoreductase molybdenum-binding subunit PaoC [Pelomonas aquatica]MDR7295274.1 xanthine dehydrogenase YagR molybdenum-binding subunit [Pelomonas aquatica]